MGRCGLRGRRGWLLGREGGIELRDCPLDGECYVGVGGFGGGWDV